jgi:hypothetical protein
MKAWVGYVTILVLAIDSLRSQYRVWFESFQEPEFVNVADLL